MKKILVLGTNAGQLDLINEMKDQGWYVIACSNRANEVGAKAADSFYNVNIVDIEKVKEIALKEAVDIIYSVSSDTAMKIVVQVSSELGLPVFYNNELVELLNNKEELREFLNLKNISRVEFCTVNDYKDVSSWSHFPCIVKPSNAQGQRGVVKVDTKKELKDAINYAKEYSVNGFAIVEEFLDGVELSCNVLLSNGEIVFSMLSERDAYEGHDLGIPKKHIIPCVSIDANSEKDALEVVYSVVKSLNIKNGPLYFQLKATSKGIKIIEIAPRLDGCHMWRLIRTVTSRNLLCECVEVLMGTHENKKFVKQNDKSKKYELVFQHSRPGVEFQEDKFPINQSILYHEYRYSNGDIINSVNGRKEVVGYYITEC